VEKSYLTKNGISIYGYRNPASHGFFISLFLKAGAMYESERDSGITHFLEHVSIRNVNKIMGGNLYSELDRRGIEFNASTYAEMVQFYVSGACGNFSFGAEIITKLFSPIELKRDEIEAERKRVKAEIRESDDKNSLLSFTNGIIHSGTSLERPITGTLSSVNSITVKRLEEYRRAAFCKENLFFYVTGNFTESDIAYLSLLVEKCNLPNAKRIADNIAPVSKKHFKRGGEVAIKNADYTMLRFTFDIDMKKVTVPETDLIYDMLLSGYASRLFIELSESRGLFYDLSGAVERYRNIGQLYFTYELRGKDILSAVEITVNILNDFKQNLQSPDSLMKCGYVDNAFMLFDDSRELNFTFAYDNHIMQLGYDSIEDRKRAYESVTSADIRRAACEIFKPDNLTLTLKGDKKKIDADKLSEIILKLAPN